MKNDREERTSLVTAYASNTRFRSQECNIEDSSWAPEIMALLQQDYSFIGFQYSEPGVLFRGMSSGLINSVAEGEFGLYCDNNPHSELEQMLQVHFISHELSDAITTSRIWDKGNDMGVLVLSSKLFNQAYLNKQAAMMAFSEPGFVFKYPFFVRPVLFADIEYLFVNQATYKQMQEKLSPERFSEVEAKLVRIKGLDMGISRRQVEEELNGMLKKRCVQAAEPVVTDTFPK